MAPGQEANELYECFCGRTHAPWWGQYVPAPSCMISVEDFRKWALEKAIFEQFGG